MAYGTRYGAWLTIDDLDSIEFVVLENAVEFNIEELNVTIMERTLDAWIEAARQARETIRARRRASAVLDGDPRAGAAAQTGGGEP